MTCAIKQSVKNLLFFLMSNVMFLTCHVVLLELFMVERGSISYAARPLLSKRKKYFKRKTDTSRERRLVKFCCEVCDLWTDRIFSY